MRSMSYKISYAVKNLICNGYCRTFAIDLVHESLQLSCNLAAQQIQLDSIN